MTNIILFDFENNHIRTGELNGSPVFCLFDLLSSMESKTRTTEAKASVEGVFGDGSVIDVPIIDTIGREQLVPFVFESGATFLVSRSRTEKGKRMNRWLHAEVLPSIRKTGSYSIAPTQPALPSRVLALETAVSIDKIQDILSKSNPRLAQILIDCAMNDVLEASQKALPEFPEDKWYGIVQIADKMGIRTNGSTRIKLGNYVAKMGFERVREERLCNGQATEIWCYRDNDEVRSAIADWHDNNADQNLPAKLPLKS